MKLQADRKPPIKIQDTPAPALARGAAILDFIVQANQAVSAQQISTAFNLPKSSVHNLCATLVALDMLSRRSDQSYVIGPHVMRWARAFTQRTDVTAEFTHVLDETFALAGAAITLAIFEQQDIILISTRNAGSVSDAPPRIGMRLSLPYSATGKAFLSHYSDSQISQMFEHGLPQPPTDYAVQSVEQLIAQARRCRVEGFASEDREMHDSTVSYATTVLDASNRPVAAVAVILPTDGFQQVDRQAAIAGVKLIAERMSARLGADLGQ